MAGLFSKGKEKLKKEIMQAQADKGQKIESDKLIIEQNRVHTKQGLGLTNHLEGSVDLAHTETRYSITLRDGTKRAMTKQLLIDSVCYNIMVEAPLYQRLVTIPMVFTDQSIPWHVSCNGRHTLLSEDILGKSFSDIVFLILKEFVHVSLGHKIAFGFDADVVMTEQRFATLRLEKNILDNVVVLNGILNNPLEYGLRERLAEISPGLKHEAESLFRACGYSLHNNAWRSELTLYHVPAILEGDSKSFNNKEAKYFKNIQYELKPRRLAKQHASGNTVRIKLDIGSAEEIGNGYKPRSQKSSDKNPRDRGAIEEKRKETGDIRRESGEPKKEQQQKRQEIPQKFEVERGQETEQGKRPDTKSKDYASAEDMIESNKAELGEDADKDFSAEKEQPDSGGTSTDDRRVDAASFGQPTPSEAPPDETDEWMHGGDQESAQEYALEVTELLQDIMSDMSDLDLEQLFQQMDDAGMDMLDSNPEQMMDFIQEFLNEDHNKEITDKISEELKDKAKELSERKNDISQRNNEEQSLDGNAEQSSNDSGDQNTAPEGVKGQDSPQSSQHNKSRGADKSPDGDVDNNQYDRDSDDSNSNSIKQDGQNLGLHSWGVGEEQSAQDGSQGQGQPGEYKDSFSGLEELSELAEPGEGFWAEAGEEQTRSGQADSSTHLPDWGLPELEVDELDGDGGLDKLDAEVTEADIESIKANLETYFNQFDKGHEQSETITVETEEYDFTDMMDYKNFLKDSMSYYRMFGAQETMTPGQYDTLRNELIASARNSHSEDGGYSRRLEQNEYTELFSSSVAWYQEVRKTILMYKPSQNSSYQRPNKKYLAHSLILQGKSAKGKFGDVEQLLLFIDSSGSMTKQDMLIFKSVIKTCSRHFPKKVKAYEFNSSVFPLKVVNGYLREDPSHSGGTVIKTVLGEVGKLTQAELAKMLVIVVSDGEFAWKDVTEYMQNYTASKMVFLVTSVLRERYATPKKELLDTISSKRIHVFEVQEAGAGSGIRWG